MNLSSVWSEERQTTAGLRMNVTDDKVSVVGGRDRTRCPHVHLSAPCLHHLPAVDGHQLDAASPLVTVDHGQSIGAALTHVMRVDARHQLAVVSSIGRIELRDLPGRPVGDHEAPAAPLPVTGRRRGVLKEEDGRRAPERRLDLVQSQHGRLDEVCHRQRQ